MVGEDDVLDGNYQRRIIHAREYAAAYGSGEEDPKAVSLRRSLINGARHFLERQFVHASCKRFSREGIADFV